MSTDTDILSAPSYFEFKRRLIESQCSKCPALCRERHHIVVDRGNPQARVVLIGEAPGENEDLQGQSFVGRAGKLLDQLMSSIGLDTNRDMIILNVVKCRPPDNRRPTPQEATQCRPYLQWQLNYLKPQILVLLGATAVQHILPNFKGQSMKSLVGQLLSVPEFPSAKIQLLYHPAYLLRDPRKKPETLGHLKTLRSYMESLSVGIS